jgi:hypothetical protein
VGWFIQYERERGQVREELCTCERPRVWPCCGECVGAMAMYAEWAAYYVRPSPLSTRMSSGEDARKLVRSMLFACGVVASLGK